MELKLSEKFELAFYQWVGTVLKVPFATIVLRKALGDGDIMDGNLWIAIPLFIVGGLALLWVYAILKLKEGRYAINRYD